MTVALTFRRRPSVLPGFGLTMGLTLAWLGLLVLMPLAALFMRAGGLGIDGFIAAASEPRVLAALELSFGAAAIAAAIDAVAGIIIAWALVRYDFPLRRLIDGLVDLPFALPTAVAGIALATLYGPTGWIGAELAVLGITIAYTTAGIVVALAFIGLPFVVRTVQPVIEDLDRAVEEAAASLGASRLQTVRRVILPAILPALLTGVTMAFARAVGEYGSVIFIAGNLPYVSEIAPLLIVIELEEYDYAGAATIGSVMLIVSFALLLAINLLQRWASRRSGA